MVLTNRCHLDIIYKSHKFGCIAQLARACGSYPQCHRFESYYSHHKARWSSGLRHRPFTAVTRVRISSGSPTKKSLLSLTKGTFLNDVCLRQMILPTVMMCASHMMCLRAWVDLFHFTFVSLIFIKSIF